MRKLSVLLMLLGLLLAGCSQEPVKEPIVNEETEQVQSVVEKEIVKEYHYYIKETDTVFPHTEYLERNLAEKAGVVSKDDVIELYNGMPPTCYITAEEYIDGKIVEDSIVKNREIFVYDLGYSEDNIHYTSYVLFEDDKRYLGGIFDVKDNEIFSEPRFIFADRDKPWPWATP